MHSFGRYALVLWLLGAALYTVSTLAFVRSIDLFRDERAALQVADIETTESGAAQAEAGREPPAASARAVAPTIPRSAVEDNAIAKATASEEASQQQAEWVAVSASGLNMRAGPSSSTRILNTHRRGTELRVLSREGRWVETVDPATGAAGWVFDRYLESIDAPHRRS